MAVRWTTRPPEPGCSQLEAKLDEDRLFLNEGHFFDKWGRSMRIDEVTQ